MDAITTLANCSTFGPWHALAIAAVAFATAWVIVSLVKAIANS